MENTNFSIQRIGWLIRNDIWEGYKLIGIFALAIFGFFLIPYLNLDVHEDPTRHEILYSLLLIGGGFIFTSIVFRELYTKPRGQFYLTLPASHLEKISSKWVLSAILYPLGITIGYWLFSSIANGLYEMLHGQSPDSFLSYWQSENQRMLPFVYIVLQSIFFLGAITFTRYNIFKTGFSLFIAGLSLVIIFAMLLRLVLWKYFDGMQFPNQEMRVLEPSTSFQDFVTSTIPNIAYYLFWFVLAPYLLLVSYFKLKEREI